MLRAKLSLKDMSMIGKLTHRKVAPAVTAKRFYETR
jgi:hypothetical protein